MSTIYSLAIEILLIALASAFIILLLSKTGTRDRLIAQVPSRLLSELFSCDFCLSFWTATALCLVFAIACMDFSYIIIPVFSAPITRKLL